MLNRSDCICEHVLDADGSRRFGEDSVDTESALPAIVISDLTEDPRWKSRAFVARNPQLRFYAGVPIRSPKGIDIGVLCVLDEVPRHTFDDASTQFMVDLSMVIMNRLESKRSGSNARRYIRMVRGLGSFVEGYGSTFGWLDSDASAFSRKEGAEGDLNARQQKRQRFDSEQAITDPRQSNIPHCPADDTGQESNAEHSSNNQIEYEEDSNAPSEASSHSDSGHSSDLERGPASDDDEDPFLIQVKHVFAKAANIVRESIEVEGVLYLDASVRSFAGLKPDTGHNPRRSGATDSPIESSSSGDETYLPSEFDAPEGACGVFGFSTSGSSSIDTESADPYQINVPEKLLKTLLQRYNAGKIFNFDPDGSLAPGDADDSPEGKLTKKLARGMSRDLFAEYGPNDGRAGSDGSVSEVSTPSEGNSIIRIIPGARSVAIVPLWDPQKERWFAAGLVWTQQPGRTFTISGEMSYLRAFGTSIMAQVSNINTLMSEKAKADVLGSLSHELRSPLHGIVSAAEMLHGTQLNAFQKDVLHSLECCGRTLLDVIDHVCSP